METLEPRLLLSTVNAFNPPGFLSLSGTYDGAGNLWFANDFLDPNTSALAQSIVKVVNGAIAETIDVSAAGVPSATPVVPTSLVFNPANGHLYFIDAGFQDINNPGSGVNASIVEIDPANPTAAPIIHVPNIGGVSDTSETPQQLTVTDDGSVWFTAVGSFIGGPSTPITGENAEIGRLGLDGSFSFTVLPITDSDAISISSNGPDSVWVGLRLLDTVNFLTNDPVLGQSHVALAHWDTGSSSILVDAEYNINTGDAAAPTGVLTSVATDPLDGSVWFTLSSGSFSPDFRSPGQIPPEQIVHGVPSNSGLAQTAYVLPAIGTDTGPWDLESLSMDSTGRLWFVESLGGRAGWLDVTNGQFTRLTLPDGTLPTAVVPNADGTDAWVVNGISQVGDTLVEIQNALTFSGTGSTITGAQENVSLGDAVLIASFTAPPGTYSASIDWGDGSTPTVVAATDLGDNTFAVFASGKIYANQGSYNGLVTVTSGSDTVGTIGFSVAVADTPMTVLSVTATPNNARSPVINVKTVFSDDIDSTASWFSATINWGDGSVTDGKIVATTTPGQYMVIGVHKYARRGTYNVLTTISTSEVNAVTNSNTSLITVSVG